MAELHKLVNGLEVLLEENHSAPVISFHMLVKTGSAMESAKEAGISHVIEHMLFKGTKKRPVGRIASDVEAAGGEINAYTSFDQTVYYINMASNFRHKGLDILSDAMSHSLFDQTELEREKEVILEEIRRENDNPSHRTSELMFTKSYSRHPYKNPIIGFEKTVKSFSREDLLRYYRKWYTAKNMTLVVVGDFKIGPILKEIKKSFRDLSSKNPPVKNMPMEASQKGLSIHTEKNPINAAYFALSFNVPNIKHKDVPALDLLSHILAGTDSSRLQQEIREKKRLVNAVYTYVFTPKGSGLFVIGGVTKPEKIGRAIDAIWDETAKIKTAEISDTEIERARLNLKSSEIYEKETTGGQAGKYAYFIATAGAHDFEKKYYEELALTGAGAIKDAAKKYLTSENCTVVIVHPKNKKISTAKIKSSISKKIAGLKLSEKNDRVKTAKVHKLQNGLNLVLREDHTLPIIACTAAFNGGLRFENGRDNGISNLTARVITKGTTKRNAVKVAEDIESVAGFIEGSSGRNSFSIRTEFLGEKLDAGMDIFIDTIVNPSFSNLEIEIERAQVVDAIKHQEDALSQLAFMNFLKALYPRHPYGLRLMGEKKTVKRIARNAILNYYHRVVAPKNGVITVVGDFESAKVIKILEKNLVFNKNAHAKGVKLKMDPPPKTLKRVEHKKQGKEQSHIVVGFRGPTINSDDHYAIVVLNNILSGQGGRLFLNLRDRMSLAYAVSSSYFAGIEPGYFAIYIGTEAAKTETAIKSIIKELNVLVQKGVTETELTRSKNHIIGGHAMDRQRNSNLADNYAFNMLYRLGIKEVDEFPKKIAAIKKKDVLRVIRKYIKVEAPVIAIVKPE